MSKKNVRITIAVATGLLLLFILVRWYLARQAARPLRPGTEKIGQQTEKTREQRALTLHRVCQYADSVGIDTSRFGISPKTTEAEIDTKLTGLLLEIRYGKKPSRLTFSGLKAQMDTAWASDADKAFAPESRAELSAFAPYRQLLGHYHRLRNARQPNPAVADSLRQIRQTLNFYRYVNRFGADRFVLVNIPAGELNVFDRRGERLLPMQVIAGKPDRRTPCMTTYIRSIVAYPYWNVPKRIVLEEMLPRMQRDLSYIYNQNLQILDGKGRELDPEEIDWNGFSTTNFPYRVRQASGCENSLGLLKFDLANPLAIYLHDTNSRDLFTLSTDRWRSHGCVRVQKPVELANLVLGKPTFDADFMNRCLIDQKPQKLAVEKPFPVFIAYNTADVDAGGRLRFYKDVYALDK